MILNEGDKILVAYRRLFERDEPRFFLGRVDAYEGGIVKVTGHSYLRDVMSGAMVEKAEQRTKVLSLTSGTLIVYQLAQELDLETASFSAEEGFLKLTDERGFEMNLSAFARGGRG